MTDFKNDDLGDRMKHYEELGFFLTKVKNTDHFVIRLDGRAFHTFTKNALKPFDADLTELMVKTTEHLTKKFNATRGYCQSDEISLFFEATPDHQVAFDGRVQKLLTLLAAECSVVFNRNFIQKAVFDKTSGLLDRFPDPTDLDGHVPIFDARISVLPDMSEVANYFVWRQQDAFKNSISMAAHSMFSTSKLHKKTGKEKIQMMANAGVDFWTEYQDVNRYGMFIVPSTIIREMTEDEMAKIPEHLREEMRGKMVERRLYLQKPVNILQLPHDERKAFLAR